MGNIRQATFADLKRVRELCDKYIGSGFYTDEYLEKVYNDDNKYIYVYVNDDDVPVAFLYMFVTTCKRALEILSIPSSIKLQGIDKESTVGVFKTVCTDEKYRRQGILKKMTTVCEQHMRECGVKAILLDALKLPSGKIPALSGIKPLGFKFVAEIKHPWSEIDSYCPYCKNRYCICDASLYLKEID